MITKIGLDLGYANITLSDVTSGIYREPAVALVDKGNRSIIAVGDSATVAGNDNPNAILVRPFKNGMLFSSDLTLGVLKSAVKAVMPAEKIRCLIGVPSDFLPKQDAELFRMLNEAGVDEPFSVKRPLAALIGAGFSPGISVISVNIGASCTDIAVLCRGNIVYTSVTRVGGEDFDEAVRGYISEQGDVKVSLSVARAIKERLGAVWEGKESESLDIDGTLALTGKKISMNICTEDIVGVFEKPLSAFLGAVAEAMKKIPKESVSDVFANGVVLTGGGAALYGMDKMLSKVLGIAVHTPVDPIDSVAKGLSRINTFIPRPRSSGKNITAQLAKFYESRKVGND